MLRICFCLLIALASASVAAREVKLSPNESCPESASQKKDTVRASNRPAVAPARTDPKAKPTVHSDANNGRLQSPRWHSFLPGMFR
ncbi:hypothetical protein LVB77_19340 [Lysobacter sp. 5GHs7-4]|uniref:hypothetical protein n=1 Tax=Lysobacter sp. 5GHs7-4 TaxID=2904253 RepID=UPI001834D603|nr:hypothetical protein [Lysobacter sp. 5GHs7-4]NUO77217.1 hypothetical protein [Lysobacter sp.]UHQ22775.1 hypothetical protein LVB77_19340 [Lysobacter sp. 5GHs7-4]